MKLITTAALLFAATSTAWAGSMPVTIDFEGATGYVNAIGNFYNGGTDSLGNSGTNYGVVFTDAAVALSNDSAFTYYSNAPTAGSVMFALDPTATMNVANGFIGDLAFYYASGVDAASAVNVYSGLNGTGTLLASISLLGNATTACSDTPYCHFDLVSVGFSGLAHSVSFGGNAGDVAFDNVSITAVPEPTSYSLVAAGLLVAGLVKRRKQG